MIRWATDRPGQPPRILTEPREDEPLEDEGWQTEHLRAPLSPIAAVLAELEVRYPPSPPANLAEAMGFPFQANDGRWCKTPEQADARNATSPPTPEERPFAVGDVVTSTLAPSYVGTVVLAIGQRARVVWANGTSLSYEHGLLRHATPEERSQYEESLPVSD